MAQEMTELVTFRNLLSHEYHGIDEEKLFLLTKKIAAMQEFVSLMQERIREDSR